MSKRFWTGAALGAALVAGIGTTPTAGAATISSWTNITNNGNSNVGGQLAVDYTAVGGTQVKFRFTNSVGVASGIAEVYFDDKVTALLATPMVLAFSAGVSFGLGANPANLPGGNTISFSADFAADTIGPQANTINAAGEWLDVTFNLATGRVFADVAAELASGDLVIGMHIRAIAPTGGSDSYVNARPTTAVPEPASLALLGAGLLGLGLARRRRA